MYKVSQSIRGALSFLLLICFFQPTLADTIARYTLPSIELLQHHTITNLPKAYWPFADYPVDLRIQYQQNTPNIERFDKCRYPAHAYYKSIEQAKEAPDFSECIALTEYLIKVPLQSVSVVYASENLLSPSSMMGHVFLKLSGAQEDGTLKQHAVSFYTNLDGINIPKLFFDTMVLGKKGVFGLSPYSKFVEHYVHIEKRNLWEYEIELDDIALKLVQLHLWELKQSTLPYYFDRYNCATLISHILRLARPEITLPSLDKVSPADVIRAVDQANVVSSKNVILSSEWRTRMLSESLSESLLSQIQNNQLSDSATLFESSAERFFYAELGLAYTNHQLLESQISKEEALKFVRYYENIKSSQPDYQLDLSNYKSPTKMPYDTQWFLGYVHYQDQSFIRLGYLPAGLKKEDDSRQYFGNNELRLMEGSILYNPYQDKIDIDEFALYSVSTLKPYNSLVGGVSGKFELIVEDHFNQSLQPQTAFNVEGGLGLTVSMHRDVSIYALPSIGVGLSRGDTYLHASGEIGLLIDTGYSSKLRGSYTTSIGKIEQGSHFKSLEVTLSKYLSHNWTAVLKWQGYKSEGHSLHKNSLTLKYLY